MAVKKSSKRTPNTSAEAVISVPVSGAVKSKPVASNKNSRIPSDHQFVLDRAKPLIDAAAARAQEEADARLKPLFDAAIARAQEEASSRQKPLLEADIARVRDEVRARQKPLSRKNLMPKLRNEFADEITERARKQQLLDATALQQAEQAFISQRVEAAWAQKHEGAAVPKRIPVRDRAALTAQVCANFDEDLQDMLRRCMDEARAARHAAEAAFLNEKADAILAQQHSEEKGRKQAQADERAAIIESVRLNSTKELQELAKLREAELAQTVQQREADKKRLAEADVQKLQVPAATGQAASRVMSEIEFLNIKAVPLIEAARTNGERVNRREINRQLRATHHDELRELTIQRDAEREERRLERMATKQREVVAEEKQPVKARPRIMSEAAFLAEKAAPLRAAAEAEGIHLSRRELWRDLRIDHHAELHQLELQREAERQRRRDVRATLYTPEAAPVVAAEPAAPKEVRPPSRARLKRLAAMAAAAAAAAAEGDKPKRGPSAPRIKVPSEFAAVRGRVDAICAEAKARGELINRSALAREMRNEISERIESRRRMAEEQEQREAEERATRLAAMPVRVRHSFEPIAEMAPAELDKRRIKRDEIKQKAAAAAPPKPVLNNASDYIAAAEGQLEQKKRAEAGKLLTTVANKMGPADPMRLQVAKAMHKAVGAAKAAEVVEPLIQNEMHAEPALALLATMQLAQGESLTAFNMLSKGDRAALKPLLGAAQLSHGIRTDDADVCAQALMSLTHAKFSNKGQVLNVDLSAYEGMPQQVRLSAGTLKYANILGEALVQNGRLHDAVGIYDTLRPATPTCTSERKDFIRALKSCGDAYYQYGVANREALGKISVPHTPTQGWSQQHERVTLADEANIYLNRSFRMYYKAFELNGSDQQLRENLAKVIESTGNPDQFEQVNQRIHRRQKDAEALERQPNDAALLKRLTEIQLREELSSEQETLLRELHRNRQKTMQAERQRTELLEKVVAVREVSDKPAHQPSALSRSRKFFSAPRR